MAARTITYRFRFASGQELTFPLRLDGDTLDLLDPPAPPHPEWTELGFCQCENCPFDPAVTAHCPIAVRVAPLVDAFRASISHQEAEVWVETEDRQYYRRAPLQRGLSAMMGVFMVTSGCPVMDRLRPLVETHLPFASLEESTCRYIHLHLLAQFFRHRRGLPVDLELTTLVARLEEIAKVDEGFSRRLQSIQIKDASLNALVILHTMGGMASFSIAEHDFSRLERLVLDYYDGEGDGSREGG